MLYATLRRTRSTHSTSRLAHHGLGLLLCLWLLGCTAAAQTGQEARRAEAEALFNEGNRLVKEGKGAKEAYRAALDKFAQAQPLFHSLKDTAKEALTLVNMAMIYGNGLGEHRRSLELFEQALPLYQALRDRGAEANTLINIGSNQALLGELEQVLDYYERGLSLYREINDPGGIALGLSSIGWFLYEGTAEKQKGLDYLAQAVPFFHAANDRYSEAGTLSSIADIYNNKLGEKQKALDYYTPALSLYRDLGDRLNEVVLLNNIGLIYRSLGEKQKMFDYITRALSLGSQLEDAEVESAVLNSMVAIYEDIGDKEKALEYLMKALPLKRAAADRDGEATVLNNIGRMHDDLGDKEQALYYLKQAAPLFHAVENRSGEARALSNTGLIYHRRDEIRRALDYYEQALPLLRAAGDRGGEAGVLSNMGSAHTGLGEYEKALDSLTQALPLRRAVGDRGGEADTLGQFAMLERRRGNLREALVRIEGALDIIESLRTEYGSYDLRASYFSTMQGYYELYIDVLMRLHRQQPSAGYDGKALQASERGRARSLLEMLSEAGADIRRGVDPRLVEAERSLREKLNTRAQQLAQPTGDLADAQRAKAAVKEVEDLTTELQRVEAQIRQASPRYAALTRPAPLSLRDIQTRVLDADTLLLEYSLGPDRSYLWAVTPTSVTSHELPSRVEVETAAKQFNELLVSPNAARESDEQRRERLIAGERLSRVLLGPVAPQLGRKRLVIVAEGALQYLPFAALPDPASSDQNIKGRQPLIVGHELVSLPSVSMMLTLRDEMAKRTPAPQTLAVLADPVFSPDDERVSRTSTSKNANQRQAPSVDAGLIEKALKAAQKTGARRGAGERPEQLAGTRKEAEGILALVPAEKAKKALDFNASRALALSGELSRYRYIHFATHGLLDSAHPQLSAIVLSLVDENGNQQDGYLRAHEVYGLNLVADVVVLSGCDTGLGKEVRGEGLVGLTRGFMYAGAARVVVSLWGVDDDATAELMVRFYRSMLKEGKRPTEALRMAQIEMLRQDRWEAPRNWAAFVVQGEWR
jgi:CHAT domain-containing protein/tetratricopeptide (TPR) repeat protein